MWELHIDFAPASTAIKLDGNSLTTEQLYTLSLGHTQIALTEEAWQKVRHSRSIIDKIADGDAPVYGINTGFGNFATTSIPKAQLSLLQENLITSHAAGVGRPLSLDRVRMLLALRINVLSKGYSGIKPESLATMIECFNKGLLSYVPEKGTVGASGDLAPLSHLALGMIGHGKMYNPRASEYQDAASVLKEHGMSPIKLGPKEGLALINGTQFITSLGAEAVCRAENLCRVADVIGSLTLEVLKGTPVAFDQRIHAARPHSGQVLVASRIRSMLEPRSLLSESHFDCTQVQDSYTLRCMPQVHGIVNNTTQWVRSIIETELNSATDNPMVFENGDVLSGGNFHGEYPAKVLDYLAIGIHELSSISERRIERLVNPSLSGLPAFLTRQGGLNSGFMIAHCTAAALVSENKVLCHPSSVDTIPTSASKEDHVSMGGYSARKCLEVLDNVEYVLAIELVAACQGLDLLRPLRTTDVLEAVWQLVRTKVDKWDGDRVMYSDLESARELVRNDVWNVVKAFIRQ